VTWQRASIGGVWALAIVGAVLVAVLTTGQEAYTWFAVVLAAATIAAFAAQLAIRRKEGFVTRVMASVTGAVVVLGLATAVVVPLG
jgi:hypothetical protein